MAKGKGGKSKGYISSGTYPTTNQKLLNAQRSEYLGSADRAINQQKAFMKGKNVVITIANPDKKDTKRRFIKVNARDLYKSNAGYGFVII